MRNRFCALLVLCVVPDFTAEALAQSVKISVKTRNGVGVESQIWSRIGAQEKEEAGTPSTGEKTLNGIECHPGVQFKIRPRNPFAQHKPTGWVDCAPALSFEVTPYKLGAASAIVLGSDGNVMAQMHHTGATSPFGNQLSMALLKFEAAVDDGKLGESAFSANELAALYRKAGDAKQAQLFSAAAIELGATAISDDATLVDPDVFTDVQSDGRRIESREASKVLKEFQQETGNMSGKWDRRTFEKIRAQDDARANRE